MSPLKSALPRAVELDVPSNRYVALGTVGVTLLARVLGRDWKQALGLGLAGFAAWSSARELDPDHPATACAALPLSVVAALLGGTPHPVASFNVVSSLRVLTASVGYAPADLDLAALGGQALWSARLGEHAVAALPGVALGLSAQQEDRFSPAPEAALLAGATLVPAAENKPKRSAVSDLLCLAALGMVGTLPQPEKITSRCDQTNHRVASQRVQRSRELALGTLAAGLLLRQTRSLMPLASAVLSVAWRRLG